MHAYNPTYNPNILLVGQRRFVDTLWRGGNWNWASMLRYPSVDEKRTPTAYKRLTAAGLSRYTSVDLLPPGLDWDVKEAERSASRIEAWALSPEGGYDAIVLLGGRVSAAFDIEGLFRYNEGFLVLPSPHTKAATAWDDETGLRRIRAAVDYMIGVESERRRSATV